VCSNLCVGVTPDGNKSNPAAGLLADLLERVMFQQVGQLHLLVADVTAQRQVVWNIDTPGVGQPQ